MAVKALYDYDYPSKDRPEVYGDDLLVHVMWAGNMMLCSAACFRAPKAMGWGEFKTLMIDPWAASDPDYDPSAPTDWRIDGREVAPSAETSLVDAGVVHKGLVTFRT
jgi:phenol/toluene 2-monooxygenase (NADH) P4/A4